MGLHRVNYRIDNLPMVDIPILVPTSPVSQFLLSLSHVSAVGGEFWHLKQLIKKEDNDRPMRYIRT